MSRPRPISELWAAVPAASAGVACDRPHPQGRGHLDESARRLSHEELAVARLLAEQGHDVVSLGESRRGGRHPDLSACGETVEVKSFLPAAERDFRQPSPQGVFNKLVDGAGQAATVFIVGYRSGLTDRTARLGLARYLAERPLTGLACVRILGDGFDLAWRRRPERHLEPARGVTERSTPFGPVRSGARESPVPGPGAGPGARW